MSLPQESTQKLEQMASSTAESRREETSPERSITLRHIYTPSTSTIAFSDFSISPLELRSTSNLHRETDDSISNQAAEADGSNPISPREIDTVNHFAKLRTLQGWRLWVTIATLCIGLLLSTLETTIIATALISISSSLGSYDKSNWIVTAYLLTYTGFLIVFARISDIFGRKPTFLFVLAVFTAFSLACGVAQTMTQLIIFRAVQGIGGAGLYSLAMAVIAEITPVRHVGTASGLLGAVFAMSSILGPILGGVITSNTTWRWVFYLNILPGFTAIVLVALIFPINAHPLPITRRTFLFIDYPGIILSLIGSIILVFALEQGGSVYAWNSTIIIATFVISGVSFFAFVIWEWTISNNIFKTLMLPVFPAQLVTHRVIGSAMLTAFLTGFPFMVTIVFLPQRFQLENNLSPVDSGIRMLALLLVSAVGAGLGGAISSKKNISWYTLVASLALQLIGLGLMSTLPTSGDIIPAQYGYQIILGLGFGLSLSSLVIVARVEVEAKDVAITMGAITQVRVLGGLIGIAVAQVVLNTIVQSDLRDILGPEQLNALLQSASEIHNLTAAQAAATRESYGKAFNQQHRIMTYFAAGSLLIACVAFKRHPIAFEDLDKIQNSGREKI